MARHFSLRDGIRAIAQDEEEAYRYPTGIADFDRLTRGGIWEGSITVLSASPGAGKTTIAVAWAAQWALTRPVVVVSVDEPWEGLVSRYAQIHGMPRETIESASDRDAIYALADAATDNWDFVVESDPLTYLISGDGLPLMRQGEGETRPVIIIDSLQRVRSDAPSQDRRTQINGHLADIGKLRDMGATIVLVSEVGRAAYARKKGEEANPLSASKESGDIEYLADNMLFFEPADGGKHDYVCMTVAKCRKGKRNYSLVIQLDGAKVIDRPDVGVGAGRCPPPGRAPPASSTVDRDIAARIVDAVSLGTVSARQIEGALSVRNGSLKVTLAAMVAANMIAKDATGYSVPHQETED